MKQNNLTYRIGLTLRQAVNRAIGRLIYTPLLVFCLLVSNYQPSFAQLNTDRIITIGRNALYFEDYVLSIQYFNQVIKLKPYLAEPYLYRAIAKIQLSDYKGALRDCDKAVELSPFTPGMYYTRGYVYRQLNENQKAEDDFTYALRLSPENKSYFLLRADVRAALHKYEGAQEDINYLISKDPKSAMLHFESGVISMSMRDTLAACRSFRRSTEFDSQNPANYSALGLTYLMLDSINEALSSLTRSISLGSKWAGDYINRGIIFYRKHNYRGALSDYDKAVSMAPDDAECYYNRGILRAELGDYNHALEDFNMAIDLEPHKTEMCYQRAVLLMQLGQWEEALHDFKTMMYRYPYFLPSYILASQAETALGHSKQAYAYRYKANMLEQKKDSIMAALTAARQDSLNSDSTDSPNIDVQIAKSQPQNKDTRKEFSTRAAQNKEDSYEENNKYNSTTRGNIQSLKAEVVNEPNIVLSYYAQQVPLRRRTNYFHYSVDEYNKKNLLPAPLQFTTMEMTLTADMIARHFEQIDALSAKIDANEQNAVSDIVTLTALYLSRAIEFAIVQDYSSAIDDCTKAILMSPDIAFAYFCRANWRYKQLEYIRNQPDAEQNAVSFEVMLRDYDHVITMQPDFTFALYNKANILCIQRNFKEAIECYTQAVSIDADFAEAYFNRGLTYIYTGDTEKGVKDLSRAGELGIYQSYNLITRFQ